MANLWCTPKPLLGYTDTQTKLVPEDEERKETDKPGASTTQHVQPTDAHIQEDQAND